MRDPIVRLLEDAAAAGRTSHLSPAVELARSGHLPSPPTLRCQQCGRRLEIQLTDERWWWSHATEDVAHDPAFDAAFDETYR